MHAHARTTRAQVDSDGTEAVEMLPSHMSGTAPSLARAEASLGLGRAAGRARISLWPFTNGATLPSLTMLGDGGGRGCGPSAQAGAAIDVP